MIKSILSPVLRLSLASAKLTTQLAATLLRELRGNGTVDVPQPGATKTGNGGSQRPPTRAKRAQPKRKAQPKRTPRRKPDKAEAPAPGRTTGPASGFPEEPAGVGVGDRSKDPSPHHALNNPVGEPDPTEWPDPYESREDPRDEPHPPTGATSTSQPHPSQDPEAEPTEAPERDVIDN